jgi:hypothetical protein
VGRIMRELGMNSESGKKVGLTNRQIEEHTTMNRLGWCRAIPLPTFIVEESRDVASRRGKCGSDEL